MLFRSVFTFSIGCAAFALPASAFAQEQIDIADGEPWLHPHSGISVPSTLAGLPRTQAIAFSPDALNSAMQFNKDGEILSVYVYRNTSGGVPVWFEQARYGIINRDIFEGAKPVGITYAFALPGREQATALKAVYELPEGGRYQSTGLALFSLGEWYVKLRATSETRDVSQLEAWMSQAVSELVLPENLSPGQAVEPMIDCKEPLEFKGKSKDAPKDGAASLLSGLLGSIAMEKAGQSDSDASAAMPVTWCRDSTLGQNHTVYRANEATDSYVIALGDSGKGVSVQPDQASALLGGPDKKRSERYSVTMHFDDENVNFVAQDRLPSPKRVIELINGGRTAMTVSTWGDNSTIELNSDNF